MASRLFMIAIIIAIWIAVMAAGVFMIRDGRDSKRTVKALTTRLILTVALLAFIVLGYFMGWISPHGVFVRPPS